MRREGGRGWWGEYDEWGKVVNEEKGDEVEEVMGVGGEEYDEEWGVY